MSRPPGGALYSPALLSLAVELSEYPFDAAAPLVGGARSRSCGSEVKLTAQSGLQSLGLQVTACAVGQAACTIFARHCAGADAGSLKNAVSAIREWLNGGASVPDWPDIEQLEAAIPYPGRHEAILLPWRAAIDALGKGQATR